MQAAVDRDPSRFAGLVLMCPAEADRPDQPFLELVRSDFDSAIELFLNLCLTEEEPVDHVRKWASDILHQSDPDEAVALMQALMAPSVSTMRPDSIEVPTLIVQGDRDAFSPLSLGTALAGAIPSAEHAVVPGGGHLIAITRPEQTNAAIVTFLDSIV